MQKSPSSGELRAVDLSDDELAAEERDLPRRRVRKGAVLGARVGFLVGMMSLFASILIGAGAGALIAKATQLRIEKGSAPRIRFA